MPQVLCIGSAGKDIFLPTAEGLILDTPDDLLFQQKIAFEMGGKHYVDDRYEDVGGCASNIAVGLARLDIDACVYAHVGHDDGGEWIIKKLLREGINCQHITREHGKSSDLSVIIVDQNSGERAIFVNRDVGEYLVVDDQTLLDSDAEWFFVGSLYGECGTHTKTIINALTDKHKKLAYNPGQHNIKEHRAIVQAMVARADLLFLNKDEATEIVAEHKPGYNETTLDDERLLLKALHALTAATVVLTNGDHGAWISDARMTYHIHADNATQARDTTGAGDAFSSGFFAAILQGHDLSVAATWGHANATAVVQHYGAQAGLLSAAAMMDYNHIHHARLVT